MVRVISTYLAYLLSNITLLIKASKEIGKAALDIAVKTSAGSVQAAVGLTGGLTESFMKSFITTDPKKYGDTFLKAGLNKKGTALMLGIGSLAGIRDGYESYTNSRMGTMNGFQVSTPAIPSIESSKDMAEEYGAGGDLVFALNRNRRG